MKKPSVLIVTPALASANNGNWRTTARWSRFLQAGHQVQVVRQYDGQPCDLMLALHARRSAHSIAQFAQTSRPLAVVLTGTDLYRDIRTDADAQRSLALADRLVVLQAKGLQELTDGQQQKTVVIEQSAPTLPRLEPRADRFDLVMVGHVRAEKDPMTAVRALACLDDPQYRLLHAGGTDDPQLGPTFLAASAKDSRIELRGVMDHDRTRDLIRHSRVLLLPSLMEGGANVLIEAVTCGVPVLASQIAGSVGMLGPDYAGYFEVGNEKQLAGLIERCRHQPQFLAELVRQCALRAPLFAPDREAAAVNQLVTSLLAGSG